MNCIASHLIAQPILVLDVPSMMYHETSESTIWFLLRIVWGGAHSKSLRKNDVACAIYLFMICKIHYQPWLLLKHNVLKYLRLVSPPEAFQQATFIALTAIFYYPKVSHSNYPLKVWRPCQHYVKLVI